MAVTWTVSPSGAGTISSGGLYSSPSTVTAQTVVTITATSVADTTKMAVATVTLNPPVAVTVTPPTATMTVSQTLQFAAAVTGSSNTAVTWAISPVGAGSVSAAGLYTAPSTVTAQTIVTVSATSVADSTKSATAMVTLSPVSISLTPTTAALTASQAQQFTAAVTGSTNTAVTWMISPAGVGTISTTGLYTAPAAVTSSQTVTVTATAVADATQSASAAVTLSGGPSISGLTPATGAVGTVVAISGSGFGATQGSGTVTFNGIAAAAVSNWSDSSITATVPRGASTGNVVVTVNGSPSVAFSFVVGPGISFLSPTSGPVGTVVTVVGGAFGASQGSSMVTFNGVIAAASSWSGSSITVAAPSGATTGLVVVTVNGLASGGATFGFPAMIAAISPTSGAAGTQVTISGSGFGAVQGTGSAWLGSTPGAVVSWSDTQIVANVASNAVSGSVRVQQGGFFSNSVPFSVNTATISGVTPTSGPVGTAVTISGSGFGASQGIGQVFLGTANGVVQSWSDGQIVAQVAPGAYPGVVQVLQNGVASNTVPFTVNTLQLASISPTTGNVGTSVTFTGMGFGASQGSGSVTLGSLAGQVVSWSDTQVVATVAAGSVSGIARVQLLRYPPDRWLWGRRFGRIRGMGRE